MRREGILDPSHFFKSAAHWRMRAEEMLTIAEETRDPTAKVMALRIAAHDERLAKYADDSAALDAMMLRTAADYNRLIKHAENKVLARLKTQIAKSAETGREHNAATRKRLARNRAKLATAARPPIAGMRRPNSKPASGPQTFKATHHPREGKGPPRAECGARLCR